MEDDLTWLVRQTNGIWPEGDDLIAKDIIDGIGVVVSIAGGCVAGWRWFTNEQYLARRAELQNKPSWKDAPEWANWLCQRDDGMWFWCIEEPRVSEDGWETRHEARAAHPSGNQVPENLLGDWRDTLEQRPADLSEPAVTERLEEATQNVLAAVPGLMDEKYSFELEFKQVSVSNETVQLERPIAVAATGNGSATEPAFLIGLVIDLLRTSVDHFSAEELAELHQLCDAELTERDAAVCGGQKYLDAHWYERGELPPVGVECEAFAEGVGPEKCKIIAYHKDTVAVQWSHFNDGGLDVLSIPGWAFRPISSDRDALMDAIVSQGFLSRDGGVCGQVADAILAAGFKRDRGAA
jgi:hypothetical protein